LEKKRGAKPATRKGQKKRLATKWFLCNPDTEGVRGLKTAQGRKKHKWEEREACHARGRGGRNNHEKEKKKKKRKHATCEKKDVPARRDRPNCNKCPLFEGKRRGKYLAWKKGPA